MCFAKYDRKRRSGEKRDGSEESGLQWQVGPSKVCSSRCREDSIGSASQ